MTDPLRNLEYESTTTITKLLEQYLERKSYSKAVAEEKTAAWLQVLLGDQELDNEVAAIENCKVEQVENWQLPAGLIQVLTAIIRRKNSAASGDGKGTAAGSTAGGAGGTAATETKQAQGEKGLLLNSPIKTPLASSSPVHSPSQLSSQKVSDNELAKQNIEPLKLPSSDQDITRNAVPANKLTAVHHWVRSLLHTSAVVPRALQNLLPKRSDKGGKNFRYLDKNQVHDLGDCPPPLNIKCDAIFRLYMKQVYQLWQRLPLLRDRSDMSEGSLETDVYTTLYQAFILPSTPSPPLVHVWRSYWTDHEWTEQLQVKKGGKMGKEKEEGSKKAMTKKKKGGWLPDGIVGQHKSTFFDSPVLPSCATADLYLPFLVMEHKKDSNDKSDMNKLVYVMYLAIKLQESLDCASPIVFGIYFSKEKFWLCALTISRSDGTKKYKSHLLAAYSLFDPSPLSLFRVANIMWRLRLHGIHSAECIRDSKPVNTYPKTSKMQSESSAPGSTDRDDEDGDGSTGEDSGVDREDRSTSGGGHESTSRGGNKSAGGGSKSGGSKSGGRRKAGGEALNDPVSQSSPSCGIVYQTTGSEADQTSLRTLVGQSGRSYQMDNHYLDLHHSIIGCGKVSSIVLQGLPVVFKWKKHSDGSTEDMMLAYEHHNQEYEALRILWSAEGDAPTIRVYDRGLDKKWKLPFLVLERVPGAETCAPTKVEDIPLYLLQILKATEYCHQHEVIHHDLKEDNILWHPYEKKVKLLDFGLAKVPGKSHCFCASTPGYAAPEIVGWPYCCSPKLDCWSVGVIMFDMLFSVMPKNDAIIIEFVRDWLPKLVSQPSDYLADVYKVLIWWIKNGSLLQRNDSLPMARQQLHTLAAFRLLAGLLTIDPEKRLTPEAAQKSSFFRDGNQNK